MTRKRKQTDGEKFEEMAVQLKKDYEAWGIHLADEILRPQGADKLSERIRLIIQPYAAGVSDYSFYKMLVGLACLAWNTSLRDEDEYPFLVDEFLEKTADETMDETMDKKTIVELRRLIHMLIDRKLELFPEDGRFIDNYQVENTASHFHIRIASTILR